MLSDLGEATSSLYLRVVSLRRSTTRAGDPFWTITLGDASGVLRGRVWSNSEDFTAVGALAPGQVVAAKVKREEYQGRVQLGVVKIRGLDERDEGRWDETEVFGEALARVRDLAKPRIAFDIETAPHCDLRTLPKTLVKEVTRVATDREWDEEKVLALNPLFSRVVSIAVGDADTERGTVLFAPPEDERAAFAETAPDWIRVLKEHEMLASFWALASLAETIVSYNGMSFDLPFLRVRSAILGVPVTTDLCSQRPWESRPHLDLVVVLRGSGRGAAPMNLDAASWAFGIESPKGSMDGSMVAQAFRERRYEEIARYNLADVEATRALYRKLGPTVLDYLA